MTKIESKESGSDLKNLEKLVGKWKLSGDVRGQIEYRWLEGGHFLAQDVDIEYEGRKIKGIEIIGHLKDVEGNKSPEIWSRFYSFLNGLTLNYVYELIDDTIVIWFGKKDSDNFFKGNLSADNKSYRGAWHWPGGGYRMVATRIDI